MTPTRIAGILKQIDDKYSVLYMDAQEVMDGWTGNAKGMSLAIVVQEERRIEETIDCFFQTVTIMYNGKYINAGQFFIYLGDTPNERVYE